jgi:hypothetical protein
MHQCISFNSLLSHRRGTSADPICSDIEETNVPLHASSADQIAPGAFTNRTDFILKPGGCDLHFLGVDRLNVAFSWILFL